MARNIRDYVKRLQEPEGHGDYWKGYNSALNDILSFIDSMEEEPVSEELEEAANAYISNEINYSHSRSDTFKAGAEWQKQKDNQFFASKTVETLDNAYKKGKADMRADAVEGYIERDEGGQLILDLTDLAAPGEFIILKSSAFQEIKCGERHPIRLTIIKKE